MLLTGIVSTLALIVFCLWLWRRHSIPLPPGPRKHFWFGNERQLPWIEPWKVYFQWSKLFGPVIYLCAYGRDIVVVNETKAALDLLEKRPLLYACRPSWSMAALTGRDENIVFMDYTERQRKARALLQAAFNPKAQQTWGPVLEDETRKLMQCLLHSPHKYKHHIQRYLCSFIRRFTYGLEVPETDLQLASEVSMQTLDALRPGRWIVDLFPFMIYLPDWIPGMGFKKWSQEAKAKFYQFTRVPYYNARKAVIEGVHMGGMVPEILQDIFNGQSKFDEASLLSAASSIYTAATDSTSAIVMSFLLLMTAHQDAQEKAYAEIANVVGTSRLPSLCDQPSLPYVNAVIKEIHRYNPIAPIFPRSPVEEDVYEGLRIPKDCWVMFNLWAMTHDSNTYPDPDAFNPDRYFPSDSLEMPPEDPRDLTFGLGKRTCPGRNLADAQSFLVIAQLLSVFEIKPVMDANGNEEVPALEYMSTFLSPPKPFTCCLVPRQNGVGEHMVVSS